MSLFGIWRTAKFLELRGTSRDEFDTAHNIGLETGLLQAEEVFKVVIDVLHCFDMHDYPELEAKPYIEKLAELTGYEFDCLMRPRNEKPPG